MHAAYNKHLVSEGELQMQAAGLLGLGSDCCTLLSENPWPCWAVTVLPACKVALKQATEQPCPWWLGGTGSRGWPRPDRPCGGGCC